MKNLINSLFLLLSLNVNAQIDTQYLINNWTKVQIVMLDGSKYISEDSNKFEQWKITDKLLIKSSNPQISLTKFNESRIPYNNEESYFSVSYFSYKGTPYLLKDNYMILSQFMEYKIEKLTKDTLAVIEILSEVKDKDKIVYKLYNPY